MNYAKLVDQTLIPAPNPILAGSDYIGNPPDSRYLEQGFKPVRYSSQPESLGDGHYEMVWTESESAILQGWRWVEDAEISDEAALSILLGGE